MKGIHYACKARLGQDVELRRSARGKEVARSHRRDIDAVRGGGDGAAVRT
jgi:hypothetical protein